MNNTIELTNEQVQQLFAFTEKHCVRHYDLQAELVDHLADAVTTLMSEAAAPISFEEALAKVYASFGVMGFAPIIASKERAVLQWSNTQKWALVKGYFTWPKAAFMFMLASVIAVMPRLLPYNALRIVFAACLAAFFIWEVVSTLGIYKKRNTQLHKLLLTQNIFYVPPFSLLFLSYVNIFNGLEVTNWLKDASKFNLPVFYASSCVVLVLFIVSLALRNFTSNVYTLATKQYPAAFRVGQG